LARAQPPFADVDGRAVGRGHPQVAVAVRMVMPADDRGGGDHRDDEDCHSPRHPPWHPPAHVGPPPLPDIVIAVMVGMVVVVIMAVAVRRAGARWYRVDTHVNRYRT